MDPGLGLNSPSSSSSSSSLRSSLDGVTEALYLLITAAFGFLFNVVVIACLVSVRSRQRLGSMFVLHGCLLDAVKCVYCVPFATSLLQAVPPESCALLGGSFVLVVTASGVNIVAMVCSEAYTFSEQSIGIDRRASCCCVLFGLVIVYVTSIIIHLGPTIIGGDFNYNDMIGNCIFVYGTVKSYVVHAMWIAIMTLVLVSAAYYLSIFHRHIQAGSTHRLASILRTVVAARSSLQAAVVSCRSVGGPQIDGAAESNQVDSTKTTRGSKRLDHAVRNSLSRSRVLILITTLFVACWYPLYLLTLVDPKFQQPSKLYKVLTFVAWSNATINPLVFLLFDRNVGSLKRLSCVASSHGVDFTLASLRRRRRRNHHNNQHHHHHPGGVGMVATGKAGAHRSSISIGGISVYERVGCRLHNEGQYQLQLASSARQASEEDVEGDAAGSGSPQSIARELAISDLQMNVIAL